MPTAQSGLFFHIQLITEQHTSESTESHALKLNAFQNVFDSFKSDMFFKNSFKNNTMNEILVNIFDFLFPGNESF